ERSGSNDSTRQKSSVSPGESKSGLRRPRRSPAPPKRRSRKPRSHQSAPAKYQPVAPPMRRIGMKACLGATETSIARESTSRVPNRTPPHWRVPPEDERASDQREI